MYSSIFASLWSYCICLITFCMIFCQRDTIPYFVSVFDLVVWLEGGVGVDRVGFHHILFIQVSTMMFVSKFLPILVLIHIPCIPCIYLIDLGQGFSINFLQGPNCFDQKCRRTKWSKQASIRGCTYYGHYFKAAKIQAVDQAVDQFSRGNIFSALWSFIFFFTLVFTALKYRFLVLVLSFSFFFFFQFLFFHFFFFYLYLTLGHF